MASRKVFCAVVVGSLSLIACSKSGSSPEPESSASASNDTTTVEAVADPMASSEPNMPSTAASEIEPSPVAGTAGGAAAPTAATTPLTDAQIVKVAETVNQGEIEQSKEIQKKAKNPQVKKLAAHMIQQHTKAQKADEKLGKKAQITPEDSSVSTELASNSQQVVENIKTASAPADAERAYIDAQVKQHETVLELLNTRLIPSAVNAELKAQLEETRSMVEHHIEEARKVQQAISESGATTPPAG